MTEVRHPLVAAEGWRFIFLGIVAFMFAWRYEFNILCIFILLYLLCAYLLFRDPYRDVPAIPLAVLSPVDGVIKEIKTMNQGVLNRRTRYIKIKIAKSGAYTTRSPTEGKVMTLANAAEGATVNKRGGLWIRTDEDDDVVLQMTGAGPLDIYPPIADVRYGERIGQGERIGVNRLAEYAELYLPMNVDVGLKLDDKVYAAQTILAQYIHRSDEIRENQDIEINIDDDGNILTEESSLSD